MLINKKFLTSASRVNSDWLLGSCVLLTTCLWGSVASSQVGISPLSIELKANRGQAQGIIDVSNNSSEPFRARVYTEPFTYSRDLGFQTLPSSPADLTPYLQFSPRELVVPPGVTRRVRLIVRFPPSIADGEYRTVIFTENLEENTTQDTQGNAVTIATRVGVTVYVRQGDVSPNLSVASGSWNREKQQIQVLVSNTGQASARTAINWTLKQGDTVVTRGNLAPTAIITESDRNLLLNYPAPGEPAPSPGEYQLTGELVWHQDNNQTTVPFSVNLNIPAQ